MDPNQLPDNNYSPAPMPNNEYPNNGYQNNTYPNNVNPNNGYQPNVYQNNQQPVNNYPANAYPNPTNTIAHKSKYIWLITVIVVAIVAVGGYVILKPHYNCSALRSANIEEYVHCHPEKIEKATSALASNGSPFHERREDIT